MDSEVAEFGGLGTFDEGAAQVGVFKGAAWAVFRREATHGYEQGDGAWAGAKVFEQGADAQPHFFDTDGDVGEAGRVLIVWAGAVFGAEAVEWFQGQGS